MQYFYIWQYVTNAASIKVTEEEDRKLLYEEWNVSEMEADDLEVSRPKG